jgi:hypothetical protein
MGKIRKYTYRLTTDSSGDVTETKVLNGKIDVIAVDYASDMASGADITILGYVGAKSFTVYSDTDSKTDVVIKPRAKVQDVTGADIDLSDSSGGNTAQYENFTVESLRVTIAQGGSGKGCVVTVLVED